MERERDVANYRDCLTKANHLQAEVKELVVICHFVERADLIGVNGNLMSWQGFYFFSVADRLSMRCLACQRLRSSRPSRAPGIE